MTAINSCVLIAVLSRDNDYPRKDKTMARMLVYIDAPSVHVLDEILGDALDRSMMEEYAVLTLDGLPRKYLDGETSDPDWYNTMAQRCAGVTS